MLKRKGEVCQHKVPAYPGLLTSSEYSAYKDGVEMLKDYFQPQKRLANILAELEKQIPRLTKTVGHGIPKNAETITVPEDEITGKKDVVWQILDTFYKIKNHGELLFCARPTMPGTEFCVIVKSPPGSAQIFNFLGRTIDRYYHTRGSNLSSVLAEFLDRERYGVEIAEKKLELRIIEYLVGRYAPDVCRRVCAAIAPLYNEHKAIENENISSMKTASNMEMKL